MNKLDIHEEEIVETEKEIMQDNLNQKLSNLTFEKALPHNFLRENIPCSEIYLVKKANSLENSKILNKKRNSLTLIKTCDLQEKNIQNTTNEVIHNKIKIKFDFYKIFQIFYSVKKFIKNMIKSISLKKTLIEKFPFNMLNDKTYYPEQKKNNCFYLKIDKISNLTKLFSFNEDFIKFYLNIFMIALIIFEIMIIPLNNGFGFDIVGYCFHEDILIIFKNVIFLIFLSNLLLNFQTLQLKKGILIKKSSIKHFETPEFWIDLFTFIYIFIEFLEVNFNFYTKRCFKQILNLFFLFSLNIIKRKMSKIEDFLSLDETKRKKMSFFTLIFHIFLILHYIACFLIYVGTLEIEANKGWLFNLMNMKEIMNSNKIYINSLYYTFGMLFFREYTSSTDIEKILSIIFFFLVLVLFLYNYNSMMTILQDLNKNDEKIDKKIKILSKYLNDKRLDSTIKTKIIEYIHNFHFSEKNHKNIQEIKELLEILPKDLKIELFNNLHGNITTKIPLFRLFSKKIINQMIIEMEHKTYNSGDIIYQPGTNSEESFSFNIIEDGEINICLPQQSGENNDYMIAKKYKKDDFFGEFSLFSIESFKFYILASTKTTMRSINKSNFLKILKNNDEDYEKYCFLKDIISLNSDKFEELLRKCEICQNSYHESLNCLHSHLFLSKYNIIRRYIGSNQQKRCFFKRKNKKSDNSLKLKEKLMEHYLYHNFDRSYSSSYYSNCVDEEDSIINNDPLSGDLYDSYHDVKKQEGTPDKLSITSLENNYYTKQKLTKLKESSNISKIKEQSNSSESQASQAKNEPEILKKQKVIFNSVNTIMLEEKTIEIDSVKEYKFYFKDNNIFNTPITSSHSFKKVIVKNRYKLKKNDKKKSKLSKTFGFFSKIFFKLCGKLKRKKISS